MTTAIYAPGTLIDTRNDLLNYIISMIQCHHGSAAEHFEEIQALIKWNKALIGEDGLNEHIRSGKYIACPHTH